MAAVDRLDKHFRRLTRSVFARYGFAYAEVLRQWPAIVGDDLGRITMPERIKWPRPAGAPGDSRKTGGTLVLRVAEGRALEVQHLVPRIIERVNGFYGYQALTGVKLLQGRVAAPPGIVAESAPETADEALNGCVEAIRDSGLRAALLRLGTAVSRRRSGSAPSLPSTRIQP